MGATRIQASSAPWDTGGGPRGLWLLGVMAVLLCTGCPETWGREGTMDKAMEKDIRQRLGSRQCPLSPDEWESLCKNANSRAEQDCPVGCEP